MREGNVKELPGPVRERLNELKLSLERALGHEHFSLVVHGSAVRGGFRDGDSDVDVILVLPDATRPTLESIANAVQLARMSARIECMILTSQEIARAADVFPLLYSDVARCHVVLAGADPFTSLTIAPKHVRLRIEQELREAQTRLRRAVIDGLGSESALAGAVHRKVRQLRSPLRALLAMLGHECPDDLKAVLAVATTVWRIDTAPLARIREAPREAHDALGQLIAHAVSTVDAMEEPS